MGKGMRIVLVALIVVSLVSISGGIRLFLAEREAFAKYMKVKETLERGKARLDKELAWTEEEAKRLRAELDDIAQQRTGLEAENRMLLEAKDALTTQLVDLEKKIEAMESEPYLAELLKERASLEVEAKNLRENLRSREAELKSIVRSNEELRSELARLKMEGQVAETLSRDLAKAKRDKYTAIEALGRLEAENRELQERFAQLAESKALLEENLVVANDRLKRIGGERDRLAEELVTVRLALKEREKEIEHARAQLAKTPEEAKRLPEGKPGSIELPPIVVKAGLAPGGKKPPLLPQGRIVTVNEEYKFVVIDLGMEDGVKIGTPFTVYRGGEEVGQVEVIEARAMISAADIKAVKDRARIRVDDVVVPGP